MALLVLRGFGVLAGLVLIGGGAFVFTGDGSGDNSDVGNPFALFGCAGVIAGIALIAASAFS